ncbi:hypothetical protein VE01_09459 [Pseudogymnoascus verrucosus]|uniref:Uncharacterized protein n=1 Tax=Pseudogymnoascus verrucosus TaxID=342668 RepID=A0A1B8G9K3_9PEZI|nr:uncharacterized protein VE01_09459 [Pseudogymnoascus verrucosus]OBT92514.1 hypothetical protein VE01_09459 [Pseudogymnoascus verrucosus]
MPNANDKAKPRRRSRGLALSQPATHVRPVRPSVGKMRKMANPPRDAPIARPWELKLRSKEWKQTLAKEKLRSLLPFPATTIWALAYMVSTNVSAQQEVTLKLTPESIKVLIEYHKELEKEIFNKPHTQSATAANSYVHRASIY